MFKVIDILQQLVNIMYSSTIYDVNSKYFKTDIEIDDQNIS